MHLQWLEVLNEQAEWSAPDDVRAWLVKTFQAFEPVSDAEVSTFEEVLSFIRQQANLLHFNGHVDVAGMNERLMNLRLQFTEGDRVLPPLRAIAEDESVLQGLAATLLMEFSFFASASLVDPKVSISRCEGLYREKSSRVLASVFSGPFEPRWRQEIPLLVEKNLVDSADVQRCGDFFLAKPKSRFCSEACRFTTFQLTKQLLDPGYLAAKQKKYRSKR
jgi:hypothetical protein